MKYFRKMTGERIYLSPINPDDYVTYTKWFNDKDMVGNLGMFSQMISLSKEKKTVEDMASGNTHHYAIVLQDDDLLIGGISLDSVDHRSRKAELGIFIGEEEYRGRGYGTEAIGLILHYGFLTLNLHNIMLCVHGDNTQGITCYLKNGFKEFGCRRESHFKDGRYVDTIYMDILATEWQA
jgi:RimJ/RimL family protein N-acetyltransferase